jgi:hypothetical protein
VLLAVVVSLSYDCDRTISVVELLVDIVLLYV